MAAGSPVVAAVRRFAAQGGPVLGICNGFQILCEAGLLPGALLRNAGLRFVCRDVHLLLSGRSTPFTAFLPAGRILRLPIAHAEGRYFHQRAEDLEAGVQVVFSYCDRAGGVVEAANPNGSLANIAGICSREGNVLGLMPHPERAAEPILGGVDGRGLLESLLRWLEARAPAVGTGADGGRGTTTIAAGVAGGGS
jgi:phosphoribosylformylglycinamidine synthase